MRSSRLILLTSVSMDGFAGRLECRTGRLVLVANEVLLWSVLQKAGAPVAVRGFGMLFDDRQPDRNKLEERLGHARRHLVHVDVTGRIH
jgi:hypothetical protein